MAWWFCAELNGAASKSIGLVLRRNPADKSGIADKFKSGHYQGGDVRVEMGGALPHAGPMPEWVTSPLTLRPEASTDEPLLYELYASTREDELARTGWDAVTRESFLRMQFNAQRAGYREMFSAGEFAIVLAGDAPIGRLVVHRTSDEIRVVDLVIAPAQRNRGVGAVLMKQLIDESNETNRPMRLHVLRGSRAFDWYERLGFCVIEESESHIELERRPAPMNA